MCVFLALITAHRLQTLESSIIIINVIVISSNRAVLFKPDNIQRASERRVTSR